MDDRLQEPMTGGDSVIAITMTLVGRRAGRSIALIAWICLGWAPTLASAQAHRWYPTASAGRVAGIGGHDGDDDFYDTGQAVAIEGGIARVLGEGLTLNIGALGFYSYHNSTNACVWTCPDDVHLLGAFGTVRQKIPTSRSGWGIVMEAGVGAMQLRTARRRADQERIALDGPAFTGGLELRTRAVWGLVPALHYREFRMLRPDATVLGFHSIALQIGTR